MNGLNGSDDITNIDEIIGVSKGRSTQSGRAVIDVDDMDENTVLEKMEVTEENDEPTLKRYSITEPIQTEVARVARETKASAAKSPIAKEKNNLPIISKDEDVEMEEVAAVKTSSTVKKAEEIKIIEVKEKEVTDKKSSEAPLTSAVIVPITT